MQPGPAPWKTPRRAFRSLHCGATSIEAIGTRSARAREKILLDNFLRLRWNSAITEQKSAVGRQCSLAFVTVFLGGPWVMRFVAAGAGSASGEHEWTAHHPRFYTRVRHFGALFTNPTRRPAQNFALPCV